MILPLLLALHVALACAVVPLARRLGRDVLLVAALGPAALLAWLVTAAPTLLDGGTYEWSAAWLPGLGVELGLRADGLSALLLALVGVVGVCILANAARYLPTTGHAHGRTAATLLVFTAAMVTILVADDVIVLYLGWEATAVTSYLLVASDSTSAAARGAARQALLTTVAGGLALLVGLVLLARAGGTWSLSELLADPPTGPTIGIALALVLVGVMTKSAQLPFHGWLPGAMTAPTPVSAFLHAATMVKAGVYLLARVAPAYAELVDWFVPVVAAIGLATYVWGAWQAMRATDLKLLLAHGTVSTLGLLVALVGTGEEELVVAGLAYVLAHGLYKAALFLAVGGIDHEAGTRDVRHLTGVAGAMPVTTAAVVLAAASMAGVPGLLGFVTKEESLAGWLELPGAVGAVGLVALVVGATLTVGYAGRIVREGLLGRGAARAREGAAEPSTPHAEAPPLMLLGPVLLAGASLVAGVAPWLLDEPVGAAAGAVLGEAEPHFAVWHGINVPLGLSVLALAVGAALALRPPRTAGEHQARLPDARTAFDRTVGAVLDSAGNTTAIIQHGSLPLHLATVAAVAVVLPIAALLLVGDGPGEWLPPLTTTLPQLLVAAVAVPAAVATTRAHHRLTAVVLLGVVGLSMVVLFALHGAPDLALTQLTVEVLTTLLFVLVLGRLRPRFRRPPTHVKQGIAIVTAVVVGVGVAALVGVGAAASHPESVSAQQIALALPEAKGTNVVNTILVDFRALDTLGEITVLLLGAVGVASLLRARAEAPEERRQPGLHVTAERSTILTTGLRLVVPLALLYAVLLLVVGHDEPGGGFAGGVVAAAALVLRHVEGGPDAVRATVRVRPQMLLATGLGLATAVAALGGWFGFGSGTLLDQGSLVLPLPGPFEASIGSYTIFDVGVMLIVVGFVTTVLQTLGEPLLAPDATDEDEDHETARRTGRIDALLVGRSRR